METLGWTQIRKTDKEALRALAFMVTGGKFLEHGSWVGESTQVLARVAQERGGSVTITDTWSGNPLTELETLARNNDVKAMFERNMEGLPFNYAITPPYDLVFIDADHRYHSVKHDIERFMPMVKNGGILCGHDYNSPNWIEEYTETDCVNHVHHGVTKAVIELFKGRFNVIESIWWVRV
jgi:predicted O-methyltransferase YrrM